MSEFDERKVDDLLDEWRFSGTTNPVLNRLLHMSDAECEAAIDGDIRAAQFEREMKRNCSCAPRGFVNTPRAEKERMRCEHIAKGVHAIGCPMWVDPSPMYSRHGDMVPRTSQIRRMERADAEAEAVDYRLARGRFRAED